MNMNESLNIEISKNFDQIKNALSKSPCDIYLHGISESASGKTVEALVFSLDMRNSSRFLMETGDVDFIMRANRELLSFTQVSTYFKLLGDGGLFIVELEDLEEHRDTVMDYLITIIQVLKEESEKCGYDLGYGCAIAYGRLHKFELFGETASLLYRDYLGYSINHVCRLTALARKHEVLITPDVLPFLNLDTIVDRYDLVRSARQLLPGTMKGISDKDYSVISVKIE